MASGLTLPVIASAPERLIAPCTSTSAVVPATDDRPVMRPPRSLISAEYAGWIERSLNVTWPPCKVSLPIAIGMGASAGGAAAGAQPRASASGLGAGFVATAAAALRPALRTRSASSCSPSAASTTREWKSVSATSPIETAIGGVATCSAPTWNERQPSSGSFLPRSAVARSLTSMSAVTFICGCGAPSTTLTAACPLMPIVPPVTVRFTWSLK